MSGPPLGHRLEFGLFVGLRALLLVLPERLALGLGATLGWLAGTVLRVRRAAVDEHLALAFPEKDGGWRARVARASYAHLGREAVVLFRLAGLSKEAVERRTTMVGFDAFREDVERGGAIIVTGHLGNWEIGGASVTARGIEIDAVAKGMANLRFGESLNAARERLGMRVVDMQEAPRRVLRTLKRGGVAALVADQNAHRGGIFVPFFGRLASTARGPALFSLRSGAPIHLGVALREPGWPQRYRVTLQRVSIEPTGDLEADVRALTVAHVAALERAVRAAPEQYFWQHKRWKKRPEEEPVSDTPVITG